MEVLIIHGSPRKVKHTAKVIEAFLENADCHEHHTIYMMIR